MNHFLLPITEKLIIFGWGWGKVACQGLGVGKSDPRCSPKIDPRSSLQKWARSLPKIYPRKDHSTLLI